MGQGPRRDGKPGYARRRRRKVPQGYRTGDRKAGAGRNDRAMLEARAVDRSPRAARPARALARDRCMRLVSIRWRGDRPGLARATAPVEASARLFGRDIEPVAI